MEILNVLMFLRTSWPPDNNQIPTTSNWKLNCGIETEKPEKVETSRRRFSIESNVVAHESTDCHFSRQCRRFSFANRLSQSAVMVLIGCHSSFRITSSRLVCPHFAQYSNFQVLTPVAAAPYFYHTYRTYSARLRLTIAVRKRLTIAVSLYK